ncbi:MAG: hypothetical protein ACI81T_003927 [Bacteroidia bacterium]|jgi:hypothetical protein
MLYQLLIFIAILLLIIGIILLARSKQKEKGLKKAKERWGKPKSGYLNWSEIVAYQNSFSDESTEDSIDSQTSGDLDLRNVFAQFNHTYSKVGEQILWKNLHSPKSELSELEQFDDLVENLRGEEDVRLPFQLELQKLNNSKDYYFPQLFFGETMNSPKWASFVWIWQIFTLVSLIGSFFIPQLSILLILVLTSNMILHFVNKQRVLRYAQAFQRLPVLLKVAKNLTKNLADNPIYNSKNILQADFQKLRNLKFRLFILSGNSTQEIDPLGIIWFFSEVIKSLTLMETAAFHKLLLGIRKHQKPIRNVFEFVGNLDFALSVASLRSSRTDWVKPQLTPTEKGTQPELKFKNLRHPLIENCVGNSLELAEKGILITGSNMSGKSTFLRTVGLNAVLAQTTFTVFADSYQVPFLKISSSMRIADDLSESASYYMNEILSIKNLLETANSSQKPCLFLIDELFKGTNTPERVSSATAVLKYLSGKSHFPLIATHDVEICNWLNQQYETFHFQEDVDSDGLQFDYQIKTGLPSQTNAIKLLEFVEFPKEVVEEAKVIFMSQKNPKTSLDT